MSPLSDLLTDLARSETRAAALTHDGPAELRAVLGDARRAGRRRLAVTLAASAAAVAVAVTATALLPEPVDRAPAGPVDTATTSPVPVPAASADPHALTRGLVAPLPDTPGQGWQVPAATLVPGSDPVSPPRLLRYTALAPYANPFAQAAGDTWVMALGDGSHMVVAGVDAGTGAARWTLALGSPEPTAASQCGGVDTAGRLVCLRTADTEVLVHLVDGRDGHVVREIPAGFLARSVAVSGDVAVVHGYDEAGVERWSGISTTSGQTLWSGAAAEPDPDQKSSEVAAYGPFAVVSSDAGPRLLDVRTGEPVARPRQGYLDLRLRVWVDADGSGVVLDHDGASEVVTVRDARTGDPLWELTAGSAAGIVPGTVLRVNGGAVFAHDARTGADRWSVASGDGYGPIEVVAFDGQRVVLAHQGADRRFTLLSAVDASTGATAWTLPVEAREVLVVGDRILLEDEDGRLTALTP